MLRPRCTVNLLNFLSWTLLDRMAQMDKFMASTCRCGKRNSQQRKA